MTTTNQSHLPAVPSFEELHQMLARELHQTIERFADTYNLGPINAEGLESARLDLPATAQMALMLGLNVWPEDLQPDAV